MSLHSVPLFSFDFFPSRPIEIKVSSAPLTSDAGLLPVRQLDDPDPLVGYRQRRSGGGRKPHATTQPGLQDALDRMIEPTARGSPTNPLRWTIKSTYRLADELRKQGYTVSAANAGEDEVQLAEQRKRPVEYVWKAS